MKDICVLKPKIALRGDASIMKARMAKWVCVVLVMLVVIRCCKGEVISIIEEEEGGLTNSACKRENSTYNQEHKGDNYKNRKGNKGGNYDNSKNNNNNYKSVLGDGGMREERVRVALESWNFCNRVGDEGLKMPSPRLADCSQIVCSSSSSSTLQQQNPGSCEAEHLVKVADNELKAGQAFPQGDFFDSQDPDAYAVQKELFLASLCETKSTAGPWHFWMIMLKNGNFDVNSGLCPSTAPPSRPFTSHQHQLLQISTPAIDRGSLPRLAPQFSRVSANAKDLGRSFTRFVPQHSRTSASATNVKGSLPRVAPQISPFPRFVHQHTQSLVSTNTEVKSSLPHIAPQQSPTASTTTKAKGSFPCFGRGCMNHPRIYHNPSTIQGSTCANTSNAACNESGAGGPTLSGSFYGTYDLEDDILNNQTSGPNSSYFLVDWSKDPQSGSWLFHHVLRVNHKYPWLMLYLRADATQGFSGGYPWETRGMMMKVPESPNFKVKLTLNVVRGGGSASQFYLLDMGGCWKNDGSQCDGNTSTDVTRYSEMIINPNTASWCRPTALSQCPPYHVDAKTNRRIYRNDTAHFPYGAYHLYCVPPNAKFAEPPFSVCDPYSNPQPQELMQLLPHPEWAVHGYPSTKGQGWVGDPRTWTLDVGGLSQRLYFYQDPNTTPAPRKWTSIDVGTEIYISQQPETAEWIVSDFDVLTIDEESN